MGNNFLWKQDVHELLKLFRNTYNYCGLKLFLDTLRSIPGTPCFALCLEVDSCKVHVPGRCALLFRLMGSMESARGGWGAGRAISPSLYTEGCFWQILCGSRYSKIAAPSGVRVLAALRQLLPPRSQLWLRPILSLPGGSHNSHPLSFDPSALQQIAASSCCGSSLMASWGLPPS